MKRDDTSAAREKGELLITQETGGSGRQPNYRQLARLEAEVLAAGSLQLIQGAAREVCPG